jgi:BON domain-containing protein
MACHEDSDDVIEIRHARCFAVMVEAAMLRALVRIILVIVVIVAAAAFLIGYRWGVPHRSATTQPAARQESPVGTTGGRAEATRERARAAGAEIGEKVAVGAEKASETLDEARLTAKVKSKIALDDTLSGSHIDVTTDDHGVTLTGTVINEAQHRRALDLARETADVSNVVDHLSVGKPASP